MNDHDDYLDSLAGERHVPLRGNPPFDSNQDLSEREGARTMVGRGMAFATTPPDFVPRTRSSNNRDTKGSRFSNQRDGSDRDQYWKNEHAVSVKREWGTILGIFPVIAPITEIVKIKNALFNSFVSKVESVRGDWKDKTEFLLSQFEDHVPAASVQGGRSIADFDDINTNTFNFQDMELLDATLTVLGRGAGIDFPNLTRERAHFIRFTLTVNPRLLNTHAIEIEPQTFPSQMSVTVHVRVLLQAGEVLQDQITKQLLVNTPKILLLIYQNAGKEFNICIKNRNEDAAPDPEKFEIWMREVRAKTKFHACKTLIQRAYVGRLEGTETLAQHLVNIRQRYYDKAAQKLHYRSIQELSQE
jgi:hypothetical protein